MDDRETLDQLLFHDDRQFHIVPRDLHLILPLDLASVLAYLGMVSNMPKQKKQKEENDGWFTCSRKQVSEWLHITDKVQKRVTGRLKNRKYIEIKMAGQPAKRWLRINSFKIIDDIIENSGGTNRYRLAGTNRCRPYYGTSYHNSYNKTRSPRRRRSEGSDSKSNNEEIGLLDEYKNNRKPQNFDERCAIELKDIIARNVGLKKPAKIPSWANQFRLLREQKGASQDRIEEALYWYSLNIGFRFTPKIYSARKFYERFEDIERAMGKTHNENSAGNVPKPKTGIITELDPDEDWTPDPEEYR